MQKETMSDAVQIYPQPSYGKRIRLALVVGFILPLPFIAAKIGFDNIAANMSPYSAFILVPVTILSTILWFTLATALIVLLREKLRDYYQNTFLFLLFQLGCLGLTSPLLYEATTGNTVWLSAGLVVCSILFALAFFWPTYGRVRRILISSCILFSVSTFIVYILNP